MQNTFSSWLEELKRKVDIVDVVSKYVHLEQKGRKFWGCCPFHSEKTPSFCVDQEGLFHCFGCNAGGDTIRFVMQMESCDFMDAVKILAESVHMDMPEFGDSTDKVIKQKKEKDRLLKVLDCAYKHYEQNLYLKDAKKAQDYIKLRGFTKRELDAFKIGYSLSWGEVISYLKAQGFSYEEMEKAGIAVKNENNNTYYDAFGLRLIFPIFNSFNECIGFSARALEKVDHAKYKNTSETPVFQKNKVVFGIHVLKKLKQMGELKQIILVEGQIDVISMHRAGFTSAVASLGTALTENHARELKKLCDNICICYDGDNAGTKATIRAIDILRSVGFNIKIVSLPDGHDPDEIIKAEGKEGIEQYINSAKSVMDYLISVEQKKYDLQKNDEKGKFVVAVLEHLRKLDSVSEQDIYLEKLRDLTNIPIDVLRRDLNRNKVDLKKEPHDQEKVLVARENGNIKAEKFILASILYKMDYVDKKIDYKKLIPNRCDLIDIVSSGKMVSTLYDEYDVEGNPLLQEIINFNFDEFSGNEKKYFDECVWSLAEQILKQQQADLSREFTDATDLDARRIIMQKMQEILRMLKQKNLEEFYG